MSAIRGRTVLVTGAASGLGKLLGDLMLREGAALLLAWDVNGPALDAAVAGWNAAGFRAEGTRIDVTDTGAVVAAVADLRSRHGSVDILVNNAGIVFGKLFSEHTHAEIDRTMGVNTTALMHLTRELLPGMLEKRMGHIVNVSSAAGMLSNPRMSVYCASKWAVIGWSDSLRIELEEARSGVRVTTVTPFYIDTGMFDGVRSRFIPVLRPMPAAKAILRGIRKDRVFVRMPLIIHALTAVRGLLPTRVFDLVVGKLLGIYDSMRGFRGRGGSA
jgi:short-subunit dehydrogenase